MSDEPALLAAILAHPDEDTPRLVYADWLDENGNPERAEFIRIQCAADADEAAEERAAELEEQNRGKWLAGLPQFAEGNWAVNWEFWRGFPEGVSAPGETFLQHYDAFARVPWLRYVCLLDLDNSAVRDFVSRPWRPQWAFVALQEDPKASIFVHGYDSTPAVVAISRCPNVSQLRELELSLFDLTDEGVRALAESPYLDHLACLRFGYIPRLPSQFDQLRERFGDRLVIG